ncbi:MAG: HD domain-containing protein [bacterium]|nr:HD domain-containing protein [bacterium]
MEIEQEVSEKKVKNFLVYLCKEFKAGIIYLNALLVGGVINFFTNDNIFASVVPFAVPLFVQAFSRASLRFVNRFRDRLMELPMERPAPVFIMDTAGEIILAGGHTRETFEKYSITNIADFIGESGYDNILTMLCGDEITSVEVYSSKTKEWYEATAKVKNTADASNILVWFDTVTERKMMDARIYSMLSFSDQMISNLNSFIRKNDTLERLARLIIDTGYEGVFIAKSDKAEQVEGYAFKKENDKVVRSDLIVIEKSAPVSIFLSRQYSRVIVADIEDFNNEDDFRAKYPFSEQVKTFLQFPIQNFVNYHEGGFSIEAFNKEGRLSRYDSMLVETLVNHTRSVALLIDLAERNDEQFLQKVIGLCAAAEYSDEITGNHIFRLNEYSLLAAELLGCPEDYCHNIGQVAALHDIGKVAIPEYIKLERIYTREESAKMHLHTVYGAKIIKTMIRHSSQEDKRLDMAYNIALNHHQRWNGRGYPGLKQGSTIVDPVNEDYAYYEALEPLKEKEIPGEGLIVALGDAYDALRSGRPYKQGLSHDEVCEFLAYDRPTHTRGSQRFGPELWSMFENKHKEFNEIYKRMQ